MDSNELPSMCEKCAELMLVAMDDELNQLNDDILNYKSCLKGLKDEEHQIEVDSAAIIEEYHALELDHTKLIANVVSVDREIADIESKLKIQTQQNLDSSRKVDKVFLEWNNYLNTLRYHTEAYSQSTALSLHARSRLKALKCFNVLNDSFFISVHRAFGTIGGLRMGRTVDGSVSQAEMAAGWGLIALLIDVICNKCNVSLQVRPVARGSNSFVRLPDGTCYPLFGPDRGFMKIFAYHRFDQGMQYLLDSVKELEVLVQKIDPSAKLPFRIQGGKIEALGISSRSGTGESCTKALKFLLLNLKYLLAFVETKCSL